MALFEVLKVMEAELGEVRDTGLLPEYLVEDVGDRLHGLIDPVLHLDAAFAEVTKATVVK